MKALVLEDIGKLEYKDMTKPEPGKGEVLVAVRAAGICGSDIPGAYRDGAHNMPLIIGHEFSGCVEAVGDGVSDEWIGKHVGIFPLIPCMNCRPCRNRQYEMCRDYNYLGSRCNGGFAEYVTVPEWNLIELPKDVSYEEAAMLEPMAVAVHAMRQILPLSGTLENAGTSKDMKITVCGLGTIGTLLVMFLIESGYKNLYVIGNKRFQQETMKSLGISDDNYCDSTKDPYDFIMEKTGQHGADVFFECVGSNDVAALTVRATAPGGSICFVGNPHSDMTFEKPVYWKILRNQITIHGTWNSSFLGMDEGSDDDWHYVISKLASGRIEPIKLITQRYPLEKISDGFELMRDKSEDYIKVMCVIA